jgi:regulator of replication initiation timing
LGTVVVKGRGVLEAAMTTSSSAKRLREQIEPLRKENARLVRENNHLHMELLSLKESIVESEKEKKAVAKKTAGQINDLRFLNTQLEHRVKTAEKENASLRKRMDALLKRNFVSKHGALSLNSLAVGFNRLLRVCGVSACFCILCLQVL